MVAAGLRAAFLAVVFGAASAAAWAESRRETPVFSEENKASSDGAEVKELFKGLKSGLGFGGDDEGDKGTDLERFEAPELKVYEELAADRPVTLAIQRSSGYGLVSAPELNAYVNRVLKRIVAASPVPSLDARAYVRAEPGFGAASTADGSIYINVGLLHDVESEDELAAVLAHELSHILYRHHGSDWFAKTQKIAAQVLSLKDAVKATIQGDTSAKPSKATILVAIASQVSDRIIAPNLWNRAQEREADRLGVDLLIAAGYRSGAARTSMQRLASHEEEMRRRAQERMDKLTAAAQTEMNETIEKGNLSQIIFGLVEGAGKVMGAAAKAAINTICSDHDSAEVRGELIDAYINREYLLVTPPDETALPWQTPGHPTAAVLANYEGARLADTALAEGRLDEAVSLIRQAVGGPTKADAYPRVVFFKLRAEQGNSDKAYRNLEIASVGPEPAFVVYEAMIEFQLALGRKDEAVRLVEKAAERLGDPPNLYPYQIAILLDAEKKAAALALHTKCALSYPDLVADCSRAFGGLEAVAAEEGETQGEGSATSKLLDGQVEDTSKALKSSFTGQ